MADYTLGNSDNITEAIRGLDIFTKNWCINCEETEKQNDMVFRCDECIFSDDMFCLIKQFASQHKSDYPFYKFGCMSR